MVKTPFFRGLCPLSFYTHPLPISLLFLKSTLHPQLTPAEDLSSVVVFCKTFPSIELTILYMAYSKLYVAFVKGKKRKILDIVFYLLLFFHKFLQNQLICLFTYFIFNLSLSSSFLPSSLIHFSVRK